MNGVAGERPAVEEGENDVEGSRIFRSITVFPRAYLMKLAMETEHAA